MTRITAIKPTKRGRFALFDESGFLFSVDGETLAKWKVCEGTVLDDAGLEELKDGSDARKAADQALRYLALRAYGERELYGKLLLKYDEHTAAAAVAKMVELELLDDTEFARRKTEGMAARGKSRREISDKLRMLGIDRTVAEAALEELGPNDDGAALALVRRQYADMLGGGQRRKVEAALARRGFSMAAIKGAIEAAAAELGFGPQDGAPRGEDDDSWEAP